jgi:DNA-binding MarR family transcriptional regulator
MEDLKTEGDLIPLGSVQGDKVKFELAYIYTLGVMQEEMKETYQDKIIKEIKPQLRKTFGDEWVVNQKKSTLRQRIKRLGEGSNLVEKTRNERKVYHKLSAKGKEFYKDIKPIFSKFSSKDIEEAIIDEMEAYIHGDHHSEYYGHGYTLDDFEDLTERNHNGERDFDKLKEDVATKLGVGPSREVFENQFYQIFSDMRKQAVPRKMATFQFRKNLIIQAFEEQNSSNQLLSFEEIGNKTEILDYLPRKVLKRDVDRLQGVEPSSDRIKKAVKENGEKSGDYYIARENEILNLFNDYERAKEVLQKSLSNEVGEDDLHESEVNGDKIKWKSYESRIENNEKDTDDSENSLDKFQFNTRLYSLGFGKEDQIEPVLIKEDTGYRLSEMAREFHKSYIHPPNKGIIGS